MSNGQSPLAALEANAPKATASVDMSRPQNGQHVTGQFLFDRFVIQQEQGDVTRMSLVKGWIGKMADNDFISAVKGMTKIAGEKGETAKKSAQNIASQLKNVFTALKYHEDKMRESGWDDKTGLSRTSIIGAQVLKTSGRRNDGSLMKTEFERADASVQSKIKRQNKILNEMQATHAQEEGEGFPDYMARLATLAQMQLEQADIEEMKTELHNAALSTIKKYGIDQAKILAQEVLYLASNPDQLSESAPTDDNQVEVVESVSEAEHVE